VHGNGRLPETMDRFRIGFTTERPDMIYRQGYDADLDPARV